MTGEAGGGDATGPSMAPVGGGTRTPDSTDRSRRVVRSGRSKGRVTGGTCVAEPRRRQAGEGSISEYATKAGPRFLIKYSAQREDGTKRVVLKRGFKTRKDAAAALRKQIGKIEMGEWVEPSKQRLDAYLADWIHGQRLSPSTLASYRKNIRLHIDPYLGAQPVARLTGSMVDAWMRKLEASGRADGQGGPSARTVRYIYTILRSALSDAVKKGRLSVNPTDRSTPPSPSQAGPPEMQAWTAPELGRFLRWVAAQDPDLAMGWRLLAATGMRRGEALALRWRDVDLDAGRLAVRRSVGVGKAKGAGERLVEGPTK